jgi:hypothetical protein
MARFAPPHADLARASRFAPAVGVRDGLSLREVAILVAAGVVAAVAVALVAPGMRLPGSAILRAGVPLAVGLALVPRGGAGTIATFGCLVGAGILSLLGVGRWQPASLVGLVALGPALDLVLAGQPPSGVWLYGRCAVAGALANGLAFAVRVGTAAAGLEGGGGRMLARLGPSVLVSFLVCGLVAGLIGGLVAFRARPSTRSP